MKEEFIKYMLNNMTLSEKIGQMIMIDYCELLELNNDLSNIIEKYQPGGFILFRSNTKNYRQTKKLLSDIKSIGDIPLFTSTDQEGGRVQRLSSRVGIEKYPPMLEVGKTLDEIVAYSIGEKIGSDLKDIGIDMNMAPVLDIYSNPHNKVIFDRSFGTDSTTVNKMAFAFASGLLSKGIIPIGKHFPGHGDTETDSHIDLPIVNKHLDELNKRELIPFIEAKKKNLPGLMVGHIALPKITMNNTPSSLSKKIVDELLRHEIGYNGLIMTDSLKMKAILNYYSNEEIYIKSINAGNDILLMPQDINKAFNIIYESIDKGVISVERINESVYRILKLKLDFNLLSKEYNNYLKNNKIRKLKK